MKKNNLIAIKSFEFALKILDTGRRIQSIDKEFVVTRQLMRSGTAIGAMVREAEYSESKADFIHKMSISLKEANESKYWIDILFQSNLLERKVFEELNAHVVELLKILSAIIITCKKNRGFKK